MSRRREFNQWFWSQVRKTPTCWLWIGTCDNDGYGVLVIDGRQYRAHRVAWELLRGPIPPGKHGLHHCDNPPCVRPDEIGGRRRHIFLGTQADNMADMRLKKRTAQGANHWTRRMPERKSRGAKVNRSRLTDGDALLIRWLCDPPPLGGGIGVNLVARLYPTVNRETIRYCAKRRTWTHLP